MVGDPRQNPYPMVNNTTVPKDALKERKKALIANSSFASIIAGIMTKTESAQSKFAEMFIAAVGGNVLADIQKFSTAEIKRRVTNVTARPALG